MRIQLFSKEMKNFAQHLIICGFISLSGVVSAHQDTRLEFHEGRIVGLPSDYSPASFDTEELELRIGEKRLRLPAGIRRILMRDVSSDPFGDSAIFETIPCTFSFTASWYHEIVVGGLPPYMVINVVPKEADCSFEILVDMGTLQLMHAEVTIKGSGTSRIQPEDPYSPRSKNKENKSEMATPTKPSD